MIIWKSVLDQQPLAKSWILVTDGKIVRQVYSSKISFFEEDKCVLSFDDDTRLAVAQITHWRYMPSLEELSFIKAE